MVDARGAIAGVLSVEIISEFLTSPDALEEEHPAVERPLASDREPGSAPLAQIDEDFFRDRSETDCISENGTFCFDWAVDNIDRYIDPALEHLVLVASRSSLGFAIALALAVLSHRRRWLMPPFIGATGVLYTIPSIAFFFLLLPITGRGNVTAVIALTAYTLQIIYRNIVTGLGERAGRRQGRRARHGHDRPPAAVAGRAAARDARDHRRAAHRDGLDRRDRDARGLRRRRRAR